MTMTSTRYQPLPRQRRGAFFLLAAAATSALVIVLVGAFCGFRINMTPSEPIGLWRILRLDRDAAVGDMVFVCLSRSALVNEARRRSYLRRGLCASGYAPLIKTVVAVADQRVEIIRTVRIDGAEIPHSALARMDGMGRPLFAARDGRIPPGHVFLHSPFPGSWDSRYFGSVPTSSVLGLAREVLTFAP
jgi:conjugative transfer signal peptidase TraF